MFARDLSRARSSMYGLTFKAIFARRNGKITARPEKQKGEIRARLGKHGKVIARVAFETRPFE